RKNQSCQSKNKSCLISSALDKKHSELLTYEHYQSGIGMVDHSFPLKSIVNIENISYETLIFELSPSNM
ncbi:hypothetical protein ACOWO9_09650, partial [Leuconostoc mesenteroides]|uniref:hypothetical protein n=1 Tax=Leuconostoc mesenteroides TaxID=1245 RepID=UPI003C3ABAEF